MLYLYSGDVVSCCIPVVNDNKVVGVVCLAISLEDFLSNIKYRITGGSSYMFLITTAGNIIYHPRLPQNTEALIESVECSPSAAEVLTAMKK